MKRTIRAAAFCVSLLVAGFFVLFGASAAPEDPIDALLRLPAPPPPNPLVTRRPNRYGVYDRKGQPGDDASIEELIEYWSTQQRSITRMGYQPEMSDKVFERLTAEIEKDPAKLSSLLGSFPMNERSAEFIKRMYDGQGANGALNAGMRRATKEWLIVNSKYFTGELYQRAATVRDTETYLTNHDELLQLTRLDYDRAKPIIDRLAANGSNKATGILAKWARYVNAMNTGSTGDIERYRDELKAIVADKSLPAPHRDLAMDALVVEKEWSGRDDWYVSLLEDETLHDLGGYTGLTTLINVSPADKYIARMVDLLNSSNAAVRSAAIRNLTLRISSDKPDVVRALLPWLENAKWAKDVGGSRQRLLTALAEIEMPEAVPGLIAILDEKGKVPDYSHMANVANAAANAANYYRRPAVNAPAVSAVPQVIPEREAYVYRAAAVRALAKQADPRAAMPLRRALNEADGYQRGEIIRAMIKCKGFTTDEQVDALEYALKNQATAAAMAANTVANAMASAANAVAAAALAASNYPAANKGVWNSPIGEFQTSGPMTPEQLKLLLGAQLRDDREPNDEFAAAVVDRIGALDKRDVQMSGRLREIVLHWGNAPVNLLFLRDVRDNKADVNAIVRLLAMRKELREKQSSDAHDLRNGGPAAIGIAACIFENADDYEPILDGENADVKRAFLACARLIRARLPVPKVAALTRSPSKPLAKAAELYLESEDSPEARAVVLGLHPGEMRILGATTAFFPELSVMSEYELLTALFRSTSDPTSGYYGFIGERSEHLETIEKDLTKELRTDNELTAVYAYDRQYVRIYKDKIMFSWDEDNSRYRERKLDKEELNQLTSYLAANHVDELAPFLQCSGSDHEYCKSRELLMLGHSGGRRVYLSGESDGFFKGLDQYFERLKETRGKSKYTLGREIPGLELILDDADLHAETVWKNGADLRIAVSSRTVRKFVKEEIDRKATEADEAYETETAVSEEEEDEHEYATPGTRLRQELEEKRLYEGYSWRRIVDGTDAALAAQPSGVTLIPMRDGHPAQPGEEVWKSRFGDTEIRYADDGLYSIARGNATKLVTGNFGFPVVTPSGRWLVTTRPGTDDEEGGVVRFNLSTKRIFPVEIEDYQPLEPSVFIPSINKVLLSPSRGEYDGEYDGEYGEDHGADDTVEYDFDNDSLWLLDPETGTVTKPKGEYRPLTQQTFRPLQRAAGANQFWAAIPDHEKNDTEIGIYDARAFTFKSVLRVPKITFNSMSMWVDETEKKVYFVYRGHLLSLPIKI